MGLKLSNCDDKLRQRIEQAMREQDCAHSPRNNPKLECDIVAKPLAADKVEKRTAGKLHILFISRRKRLCDPDNLSAKWLLDCLRYCGAIDGDEPEKITLEVKQEKCAKNQQPHTIIQIERIEP